MGGAAWFGGAAEWSSDERHPHIPPLATWKIAGVATVAAGEGSREICGRGGGELVVAEEVRLLSIPVTD
jgi:hypothetical protein